MSEPVCHYLVVFEGWYGSHPKGSHVVHPRLFRNENVAREWAEQISSKYNVDYALYEIGVDEDHYRKID